MFIRALLAAFAAVMGLVLAAGSVATLFSIISAAAVGITLAVMLVGLGWWPVAAAGVAGFGAGVQSTWFTETGVAVKCLLALAFGLVLGRVFASGGLRMQREQRWVLAAGVVALVVVARVATLVWGNLDSGELRFPGLPALMTGEWGRVLAVVAVGLALTGADRVRHDAAVGVLPGRRAWAWLLLVVAPAVALTAVLLVVGDLGPAVILAATLGVMIWRSLGGWLALPVLSVAAVGVLLIGMSSTEWATRWTEVQDPRADMELTSQLATALRSMGETGMVGGGPGSGSLTHRVPMGQSDYALATVAGDYGLLAAIVMFVMVVGLCLAVLRASVHLSQEAGLIATGAGWMLTLTTLWVAAGTFGLLPFTGVNLPLVAMSGSAAGATGVLLGAVSACLARDTADGAVDTSAARVTLVATLAAGLVLLGMLGQGARLTWTAGDGRLMGESALRSRGELLYSDGSVLATSNGLAGGGDSAQFGDAQGRRRYLDGALASAAGWFDPSTRAQSGMEFTAAGVSTCGDYRDGWGRAATVGIKDACDPADVVTTIDPTVQTAAERLVEQRSGVSLLVVDRATAGIVATAQGTDASIQASSASLPVFTDRTAPGSVFKLVTAAAATEGLTAPVVGDVLNLPEGGTLSNAWLGSCPGTDVEAMLAYSCNTVAGWIALHEGAQKMASAAELLGFGHTTVAGPPDLSAGSDTLEWNSGWADTGLVAVANSTGGALARTGIGQQGVRASVADISSLTDAVLSGQVRPLTFVSGWCEAGQLHPWATPSREVFGVSLDPLRAGMAQAVAVGTAQSLSGSGVVAAKTGTADSDGGTISWVTAATDTRIITVRVLPTADNPHPHTGAGGAVDALAALLPLSATGAPTDPCQGR